MKVCITDIFGSSNRGDALLCDALVHSIRDAFPLADLSGVAHFPNAERRRHPGIDWQEAPGRSHADNKVLRRIWNGLRSASTVGYASIGAPPALRNTWPLPMAQLAAIRNIKNADLVVSSAGGFLLDANATIYSHLLQFYLARRFGRPYVLAPQTIGPIRGARLKQMTATALSDAVLIAVREKYSYRFLIDDLGLPPAKVVRTTDIAFEHEGSDVTAGTQALLGLSVGPDERFIAATAVNWPFPEENAPKAAFARYRDKLAALLTALHGRYGRRIVLLNQVSEDLPLARDVAARCGDAVVVDEEDRTTEVMRGMTERADVLLGSRFHSCVFALLGRVPLYCLAYTYKSTGIMEDLGLTDRIAPIGSFDVDHVAQCIGTLLDDRDAESKRIDTAIRRMAFPRFSDVLLSAAALIGPGREYGGSGVNINLAQT